MRKVTFPNGVEIDCYAARRARLRHQGRPRRRATPRIGIKLRGTDVRLEFRSFGIKEYDDGTCCEVMLSVADDMRFEDIALECYSIIARIKGTLTRPTLPHPSLSFANAPLGGIAIIGFTTEKDSHDRDVISETRGITRLNGSVARMEAIIDEMVRPIPRGLVIDVFHRNARDVIAILVPPQSDDLMPFIVKGASIDAGKIYGQGFTWVERRGTSKRAVSVEDVQARLRGSPSQ